MDELTDDGELVRYQYDPLSPRDPDFPGDLPQFVELTGVPLIVDFGV